MTNNRPLRVFLCHSSNDKPTVRELYQKLRSEPWIQPWLDEEDIFPGDDWNLEIQKAIRETDTIIVCLSKSSITKEGYVQREIKTALDYSDEKPERTVYIIPIRLEECKPPERLSKWQYADYFEGQRERGLQKLLVSLQRRADSLGLKIESTVLKQEEKPPEKKQNDMDWMDDYHSKHAKPLEEYKTDKITLSNGMEFMRVPAAKFLMGSKNNNKLANKDEKPQHTVDIPYDYWMAHIPVTNEQYSIYEKNKHPVIRWKEKRGHPVTNVSRLDALVYCQWLDSLLKGELQSGLVLRLPTEAEWEKSARGTMGWEYPWGTAFDIDKCKSFEGEEDDETEQVGAYSPEGDSPYGCADMVGNVWEWTHSLYKPYPYKINDGRDIKKGMSEIVVLRGGPFFDYDGYARCANRFAIYPTNYVNYKTKIGFRLCLAPLIPE